MCPPEALNIYSNEMYNLPVPLYGTCFGTMDGYTPDLSNKALYKQVPIKGDI